jgi:hypothetical protein
MLCRQWQFGEFSGDDAGSPVQATMRVTTRTLTTYRPGDNPASTVALDPNLPLEVHVEREPAVLKLRAAVQLGLHLEDRLRAQGVPDAIVQALRTAYPLPAATAADAVFDGPDGASFRDLATGRVVDGTSVFLAATGAGGVPPLPAVVTGDPTASAVIAAFVAYRRGLYSEPTNDRAWQPTGLAYDFAIGAPLPGDDVTLHAEGFPGGHLDWYDFRLGTSDPAPQGLGAAPTTQTALSFLPQHVTFRGMPNPRWWTFESGVTDFGALDAEPVDLAKLLVMEFALTYGNDWFIVPVPSAVGTISMVTPLVVTDTFGQRTLIRPSEQTLVNPGETPWSMFKLSGTNVRSPFVLLAPTLGATDEGATIENVHFLRDDMAAMAWAVEHQLHGTLDAPVDAFQSYLARARAEPVPRPTPAPGDPPLFYTLESLVPDNWIPMVPVQTPTGGLYFRRGVLERPAPGGGVVPNLAHASVLEPGVPFFLTDRVLTRVGTVARIAFRRARGTDGQTYLWYARRSGPGAGPGWSGLRFDFLQNF